ncbi:MAG: response regulator [Desulfuromonadia bacterium]
MSTRLLLADDSHTIQKVVGMIFPAGEYELTAVSAASELLPTATRTSPDIILLDTRLGDASGLDLCRALRSNPVTANTPIILLSGAFEQFSEEEGVAAGADDSIVKPFEAQLLIDKVTALLSRPRVSVPPPQQTESPVASPMAATEVSPFDFASTPGSEIEPASLDIFASPSTSPDGASIPQEPPSTDQPMESLFETTSFVDSPTISAVSPLESTDFLSQAFQEPDSTDIFSAGWPTESAPLEPFTPTPEPPPDQPVSSVSPLFESVEPPSPDSPPSAEGMAQAEPELSLSEAQIEQIVARISREIIEKIAWEVVPDLAEILIKEEIRKIKEG